MGHSDRLRSPSLRTRLKYWHKQMSQLESSFPALDMASRQTTTPDEIVEQSKVICQDFIHEKLKAAGILSSKVKLNCAEKSHVSLTVIAVGQELVKLHPKVYRDLSRKLNMTMNSATLVDKTLTQVLEQLLGEGEITWAKVISMFALAGQFAVECVQQGHPEFVEVIVDSIGHFVSAYLTDWVISQRGWVGVLHAFRSKPESYAFRALTILATVVGLLATFVATVRIR
ncbi:bcl-2-related ovarian killer protein homolog B-like [Liolophura sinensis]|uniref:bcl-2-related ovarian killer protein homolog B-like n=1 Tax=Liolophura sinensis TaxID=3198878 RepID=UPI00315963FF